jgi:hypothetical protein
MAKTDGGWNEDELAAYLMGAVGAVCVLGAVDDHQVTAVVGHWGGLVRRSRRAADNETWIAATLEGLSRRMAQDPDPRPRQVAARLPRAARLLGVVASADSKWPPRG